MKECKIVVAGEYDLRCTIHDRTALECSRAEVKELQLQIGELADGLKHMKLCGNCAEDGWNTCEGGRAAQTALDKATSPEMSLEELVNDRQHLLERVYLELYASSHDEREHKREECLKAARAIAERIAKMDRKGDE